MAAASFLSITIIPVLMYYFITCRVLAQRMGLADEPVSNPSGDVSAALCSGGCRQSSRAAAYRCG